VSARTFGINDLEEFSARLSELRTTLTPPQAAGRYIAYTDGACFGNPSGPGGWAAAMFGAPDFSPSWHLFGHLSSTSNNRAEALGVLAAMEWAPASSQLALRIDSELTVRILQGRYKVKANADIWERIFQARSDKRLQLDPDWVRGHAGDPLNELADRLSKAGALNGSLEDVSQVDIVAPPAQPPELIGLVPRGEWEREFLMSVAQQLRRGRSLSPKQQAIVDRIRARGTGEV
jgi:ribonuclease HI